MALRNILGAGASAAVAPTAPLSAPASAEMAPQMAPQMSPQMAPQMAQMAPQIPGTRLPFAWESYGEKVWGS